MEWISGKAYHGHEPHRGGRRGVSCQGAIAQGQTKRFTIAWCHRERSDCEQEEDKEEEDANKEEGLQWHLKHIATTKATEAVAKSSSGDHMHYGVVKYQQKDDFFQEM